MLHVDAALAVLALASQVAVAAGHGRRAQAWSGAQGHLWGSCGAGWGNPGDDPYAWGNLEAENVYGNVTSCTLSDATCSDRLSDGPSDADIELVLGNLPPSTSEQDVHLHWWAARKSMSSYDPLISPHGCAIYDHMGKAYPKYWEEDFNGGNVRVNESGVAVIRFRSPATYLVKPYISWPHVHFRVCEGTASAQFYYDSLVIAERLWMNTKSQDSEITVISAVPFAAANAQSNRSAESSSSAADRPIGVLVYRPPTPSSPAGASTFTSTGTTTTAATTAAPELEPFVIQEAKEKLQLDALEFSPVYECLLDDSVFDHFSGECVNDCPQNAELHQGQCVLPAQDGVEEARFRASWRLEDLDAQVKEATSIRKEENEEYKALMQADSAAKELLGFAKNRMNKFYNPKLYNPPAKEELSSMGAISRDMSFVQISEHVQSKSNIEPPPETWDAYAKKTEESNGVIQMMDLLIKDLDKEMTEAETEEKNAQEEYDKTIADAKAERVGLSKTLKEKTAAKADMESDLEGLEATLKSTSLELMATEKYIGDLHAECDWLLKYFDVRADARAGEIDALGKAKAVLSGADYSL